MQNKMTDSKGEFLSPHAESFARIGFVQPISSKNVISTDQITSEDVSRLISGSALAIRVPNVISQADCGKLVCLFLKQAELSASGYSNLPRDSLIKIGSTLYEAVSNSNGTLRERLVEYLSAAEHFNNLRLATCSPSHPDPLDTIKAKLRGFSSVEHLKILGASAFAGLIRIVRDGSEVYPHNDDLRSDIPWHTVANALRNGEAKQIAVNIYFTTPESGGTLKIWDHTPSASDYTAKGIAGSDYGIDERYFGLPACQIDPLVGELVLFDSTKMHSVSKASGPSRVSLSFFIAYFGRQKRAVIWS